MALSAGPRASALIKSFRSSAPAAWERFTEPGTDTHCIGIAFSAALGRVMAGTPPTAEDLAPRSGVLLVRRVNGKVVSVNADAWHWFQYQRHLVIMPNNRDWKTLQLARLNAIIVDRISLHQEIQSSC